MRVKTVLGDEQEVTRTYGDGSIDCPYCQQPILVGTFDRKAEYVDCPNGFCDANPNYPPQALAEHRAARAAKTADDARRKRDAEWARERSFQEKAARDAREAEELAEARRRGTCVACLWSGPGGKVKYVKHRGPCPKSRK